MPKAFCVTVAAYALTVSGCESGRHKLERLESNKDKACAQVESMPDSGSRSVSKFLNHNRFPGLSESATHDDSLDYVLKKNRGYDLDCGAAERDLKLFMEGR